VAPDSADIWQNPSLFEINPESGQFSHVAGVPPDYFNEDGQYWGNPLYDWVEHKKDGYDWWKQRLHAQLVLFDIVRIDHFRGFHDFWSIPVETQNAKLGEWKLGPGKEFWDAIRIEFPTLPFLAEDLGLITNEVRDLRISAGLPGMAVLQFAFDGNPENLYLPHNLTPDLVLYTGTHDNDTTCGWYHSSDEETQGNFRTYFNIPGEQPSWDMLRMAYRTTAQLVVIPIQDLLSLGSDARLNEPGHPFGNWVWRLSPWQLDQLIENCSKYLKDQAKLSGRLPNKVVARSENYL
jgi:4-alpha-glucanotransferase